MPGLLSATLGEITDCVGAIAPTSPLAQRTGAMAQVARNATAQRPSLDVGCRAFLAELMEQFGGLSWEVVIAIHLDAGKREILREKIADGSLDEASLRGRALFGRALQLGTANLVLVHNHPSGSAMPSATDIATTRRIADMAAALDIELVDHIIASRGEVYSMRRGGHL